MAQYGDQGGFGGERTDEYGNPIPIHHHQPGDHYGTGIPPVVTTDAPVLHRSGSSSSSSSEDDGQGGRRKKLKDRIKDKLPVGGHKEQPAVTGHHGGAGVVQHEPEKKGMIDKIKEKLPGHHNA